MIQHREAQAVLTAFFVNGKSEASESKAKAEFIKNKLADDDFDVSVNEANASYLERVAQILAEIKLPDATLSIANRFSRFQ